MKKLLFLLLPAFMMSCGSGVEQYRASIEELSTAWDSTTAAVTEIQSNIGEDLSTISKTASQLRLSDETVAKLSPEQATEWQNAQSNFTQALQAYAPIRTEIGEFTNAWGEETAKLQSLKDGLAAGTLDATATTQINELTTLIAQAKERVSGWKEAYASAKTNTEAALAALKTKYDELSAAVPAK
jgi:chromosome segregation ATPase